MDQGEVYTEPLITEYLFQRATERGVPLSGAFELTPLCNFRCRMCYVTRTPEAVAASSRPPMALEDWLSLARQAREHGLLFLLLTGGEPLLWPDFWPLYRELSGMGFQLSINSNGSLIDEAAIAAFTRQPPSRINITLYGASENTYASLCRNGGGFRRTVAAIDGLRKAGIPVKLNCSLTPWNAGDLEAMVQFAQERELILEVNTYMFPPLRRDGDSVGVNQRFTPEDAAWWHLRRYQLLYGEERFQNLIRAAADGLAPPPGPDELCGDRCDGTVACRAGRASFWVTWDGWLTPCGMAPEPKTDLRKSSFSQAWEQIKAMTAALRTSSLCPSCPNRNMCHSCMAIAMSETGRSEGVPQYLCRMMEAMKIHAEAFLNGSVSGQHDISHRKPQREEIL